MESSGLAETQPKAGCSGGCLKFLIIGIVAIVLIVVLMPTGIPLILLGGFLFWSANQIRLEGMPYADGVEAFGEIVEISKKKRTPSGRITLNKDTKYNYGGHAKFVNPITQVEETISPKSYYGLGSKPSIGEPVKLSVSASDPKKVRVIKSEVGTVAVFIAFGLTSIGFGVAVLLSVASLAN